MASKCMFFYAREPLRWLNSRITPLTSGPQNPPKIKENHGLAIRIPYGSLAVWQYSHMASKCKVFYAREALRSLNSPISRFTSGPQNL